jgi:hypothetical protein
MEVFTNKIEKVKADRTTLAEKLLKISRRSKKETGLDSDFRNSAVSIPKKRGAFYEASIHQAV